MRCFIVILSLALLGCVTSSSGKGDYVKVTFDQLVESPRDWDGKRVEVSGVGARGGGWNDLLESVYELCAGGGVPTIPVVWNDPTLLEDFTRRGTFRGVFWASDLRAREQALADKEPQATGRLIDVSLVEWHGPYISACF